MRSPPDSPAVMRRPLGSAEIGLLAGAAAYAMWGLFPLYFHHLASVRSAEVVGLRVVTTWITMLAVLGARRQLQATWRIAGDRRTLVRLGLAGLMVSANWAIYVWAVANDHVVDAAIGYFVNPLVSVVLGILVLHERLRPLQRVALALGAGAVVVLTAAYGRFPWIALSLAFTFAMYGYLKKTTPVDALASLLIETTCVAPLAAIGLAVIALRSGLDTPSAALSAKVLLALVGVVTAIPLVLFGAAARRIPLSMIGLLQYLTPTLQMLCGVVVYHESVPASRWLGVALVWIALAVLTSDTVNALRRKDRDEILVVMRTESA